IRDFHVTGVQTCALPIFDHELDDQEDTARRRAPGGRAGGQTAGKMSDSDSDSGSDGAATGVPKVVGGNPWPAAEAPASPTADTKDRKSVGEGKTVTHGGG